jgi:hypothetical protein
MKLVLMQNNKREIFNSFIRTQLENIAPDMTLLDSAFTTFLLERKERKKKKRWFFWLFLLLPVFIIPFNYHIISNKNNFTNTKLDVKKENTPIIANDTSTILNTETNEQKNSSDTAKEKLRKSIQLNLTEDNKARDVDKLQQKKINDKPNTAEQNGVFNKITPANSVILSGKVLQKNIFWKVDSVIKKKDKVVTKADTFYIVW